MERVARAQRGGQRKAQTKTNRDQELAGACEEAKKEAKLVGGGWAASKSDGSANDDTRE